MARKHEPVVQLITRSRYKLRPVDPVLRRRNRARTWKMLLLFALTAILTVGHLLGGGTSFPTLAGLLNDSPRTTNTAR